MATLKIENAAGVKIKRLWTADAVRELCIRENFYTAGDNSEYKTMLNTVKAYPPNVDAVYTVARDICEHSHGQTISNIMFLLERYAIYSTVEKDGCDEF